MTPRELIRHTAKSFRAVGIPDPENDSALLLSHLTGKPVLELRLDMETQLNASVIASYRKLADRRISRIPLQYLLEEAHFRGHLYKVDPRALIPRPETELLVGWALSILKETASPHVLDLCCGSGCIGLAIKSEHPDAVVTLSDLSPDALSVAAENAERLSLDVSFFQADLFEGIPYSAFDLIISNPPYIPSEECDILQPEVLYEPRLALDGGADGCELYRRIVSSAVSFLAPEGKLMLELGIHESDYIAGLLSGKGYRNIEIRKDYAGIDRMIFAVSP